MIAATRHLPALHGDRQQKLVARFDSLAERDIAVKKGFATVITEGSEKLNDIVKALSEVTEAGSSGA